MRFLAPAIVLFMMIETNRSFELGSESRIIGCKLCHGLLICMDRQCRSEL